MKDMGSLTVLGCGKMGTALLDGWLKKGLNPQKVIIFEPFPSPWLKAQPIRLNDEPLGWRPDFCLIAVKPQTLQEALHQIKHYGNSNTVILSIVAGSRFQSIEEFLGPQTPIIRAMPNTPSAIGKGVSALVRNQNVTDCQFNKAQDLLQTVGETVTLDAEPQLDIVTGISGSGPAYLFHLMEGMIKVGIQEGLTPEASKTLVTNTIIGAGELAKHSTDSPEQLRINVTSPKGTTEAGLVHLMDAENGLEQLIGKTIRAAINRSRQIGERDE